MLREHDELRLTLAVLAVALFNGRSALLAIGAFAAMAHSRLLSQFSAVSANKGLRTIWLSKILLPV